MVKITVYIFYVLLREIPNQQSCGMKMKNVLGKFQT